MGAAGSTTPRRGRGDAGQFAGIEAIPFSILVFVIGSLLVTNAWAVVDAKMAVTSAAREAGRTYVEAPDTATAYATATAAGRDVVAAHGRNPDRLTLTFGPGSPPPLTRCTRITTTASTTVPAISLPFIGGYGNAFTVTSTHTELVDPYRSGLTGLACV